MVDRVEETGPISISNNELLLEHRLKKNDLLVAVNDVTGETSAMMTEFVEKTEVTLTVRRSVEVFVDLERESVNTSLGMVFPSKPKGTSLLIAEIVPGLVHDYNLRQKDESLQIQAGDRILAVNGEESSTSEGLMNKLSDITGTFRLTIHKMAPASSEELVGGKAYWYYVN